MLLLMPVDNIGTEDEPHYHVTYPTYRLVDIDYVNMVAIIDVPDSTLPRDFKPSTSMVTLGRSHAAEPPTGPDVAPGQPGKPARSHRGVIVAAPPGEVEAWHQHLDSMYAEHAGRFRPLA